MNFSRIIKKGVSSQHLELVFINMCSSKQAGELLASKIGIKHIIATCKEIFDPIAIQFAGDFYHGLLVLNQTIQQAFDRAKYKLKPGNRNEFILIGNSNNHNVKIGISGRPPLN